MERLCCCSLPAFSLRSLALSSPPSQARVRKRRQITSSGFSLFSSRLGGAVAKRLRRVVLIWRRPEV
ncbi:hypothetical protein OPV22_007986 [Ensete ventricosum]|uniref:Uncharacterized protein n=1 Tax=Ensete ventricosum TaxID=4639 RepID=A0AAV8R791_ENSVE|nr:hypothetical protein OPV22_007986 [Ensete ventricosum]